MSSSRSRLAAVLAVALAASLALGVPAEARRGGSFGSRGSRTYAAPSATYTAPGYVGPVQRSMTPNTGFAPSQPGYRPYGYPGQAAYPRPGFGGFGGGGFMSGLLTGGLIGGLLGHHWGGGYGYGGGYGGGAGMLGGLFQLLILGLVIWFVLRLFRRRSSAPAGFSAFEGGPAYGAPPAGAPFGGAPFGGAGYAASAVPAEIAVTPADQQTFERLLTEVQEAFGREDYGALRDRTTPEVMSYLAEELSDNATHGRRNEVSRVRLLQADVSEAWREGDADYATVALRYESIDTMRDRQTGAILQGDPNTPTATSELWTFVRHAGGPWKLSAIQET